MIDQEFINWIQPHVKKIYGSHKNMRILTFKVKSGHHGIRRIDYLFQTKKGKWGVIEFEPGDKNVEINNGIRQLDAFFYRLERDSMKILTAEGEEVKPYYFFLATKYSKLGYLLAVDRNTIPVRYNKEDQYEEENTGIFYNNRHMWDRCGCTNLLTGENKIGINQFSILHEWKGEVSICIKNRRMFLKDL